MYPGKQGSLLQLQPGAKVHMASRAKFLEAQATERVSLVTATTTMPMMTVPKKRDNMMMMMMTTTTMTTALANNNADNGDQCRVPRGSESRAGGLFKALDLGLDHSIHSHGSRSNHNRGPGTQQHNKTAPVCRHNVTT